MKERCFWVNLKNSLYVNYHDYEWSKPKHDDRELYELLILEMFQAGLSWECVLNKRENFRRAFDEFDIDKVVLYDDRKVQQLIENRGIIRNKLKINASIKNSFIFKQIQEEYGSFDNYIWSFTDYKTIKECCDIRTTSPLSDKISKSLKKRGMTFVGSTIVYSYLQAIGVIDAHCENCFCYKNDDNSES